ncbi:MAG: hypothetical protein ACXV5Q_07435 [Frankiaceae bacterium]
MVAFPKRGTVLPDLRGDGRVLRVSWHQEEGVFVLSTWRAGMCVSSVRLSTADAAELVSSLAGALAAAHPAAGQVPAQNP